MKRPDIDAQRKRLQAADLPENKLYYWGQWNSKYDKDRPSYRDRQSKDLYSLCIREGKRQDVSDPELAEEIPIKAVAEFFVHAARDLSDCHVYIGQLEARHRALIMVHEALVKEHAALKEATR